MILRAHAKVNLHLDIGPRRTDGYHDLETVFQEISLHDTLRFSAHPSEIILSLSRNASALPTTSDNLVVRALEMLRRKLRVKRGIRVHLTKEIPMGAGLGGGSSDAAAALWGGWLLWNARSAKRPSKVPAVLLSCAKKLGADVPFFLQGGLAYATGIGEKLTPLAPQPKRWMVLVYPRVHVATPLAYKLLDESRAGPRPNPLPKGRGNKITSPFRERSAEGRVREFNSFEPTILKKFPEIARAKNALLNAGCTGVMMSGSGSTVFGFAKSKSAAQKVVARLRRKPWDSFVVHTR